MRLILSDPLIFFAQELQRVQPYKKWRRKRNLSNDPVSIKEMNSSFFACGSVRKSPVQALTRLCSCLEASTGVLMSSEGLNQRFNLEEVDFIRMREKRKASS